MSVRASFENTGDRGIVPGIDVPDQWCAATVGKLLTGDNVACGRYATHPANVLGEDWFLCDEHKQLALSPA